LLRREDLELHESDWVTPLKVDYRGLEVYTTPPNSQGIAALQILNGLSVLRAERFAPGSADHIDLLVRAKRVAFADRERFISDPERVTVPVRELLSMEHAQRALAAPSEEGTAHAVGGDTVYLCAVDGEGNACSMIQSLYFGFGSGFTAGETGVVLHNRGHHFSLADEHANRLEPGKRTLHTLMASMALRDGRPRLVFGTMGADGQPQGSVQVLERVLGGATPQEAVSAPRVLSGRFHPKDSDVPLHVEADLGADVIEELAARGHEVSIVPPKDARLGHAHAILVDGGEPAAGIDPRSDGLELGGASWLSAR
jgi:gamma-glutamyltranspeptidase/glutathione hydrolase